MRTSELDFVLGLIDRGFDSPSWHGPNLRGSIRRVDLPTAAYRPQETRHNVWEHVVHTAYWKYVARRRLLGEKRGSFPLAGSNWFVRPAAPGAATQVAWQDDVRLLDETHRSLRAAIAALEPRDLFKTPSGSKVSNFQLIAGVAAHDIYHAGQIQLLKRLAKGAQTGTAQGMSSAQG